MDIKIKKENKKIVEKTIGLKSIVDIKVRQEIEKIMKENKIAIVEAIKLFEIEKNTKVILALEF